MKRIRNLIALAALWAAFAPSASADITSIISLPAGPNGAVQINRGGFFGSDSPFFNYSTATHRLTVQGVIFTGDGSVLTSASSAGMTPGASYYAQITQVLQGADSPIFVSSASVWGYLTVHGQVTGSTEGHYVQIRPANGPDNFLTPTDGSVILTKSTESATPGKFTLISEGNDGLQQVKFSIQNGTVTFSSTQNGTFASIGASLATFARDINIDGGGIQNALRIVKGPTSWAAGDTMNLDFTGRYTFSGTTFESTVGRIQGYVVGTNGGSGAPYGGFTMFGSRSNGPEFVPLITVRGSIGGAIGAGLTVPDTIMFGPGITTNFVRPVQLLLAPGGAGSSTATLTYTTGGYLVSNVGIKVPTLAFDDGTLMTTAASGSGSSPFTNAIATTNVSMGGFSLNNVLTISVTSPTINGVAYKFPTVLPPSGYALWLIDSAGNVSTSAVVTNGVVTNATNTISGAWTLTSPSGLSVNYGVVGGSFTTLGLMSASSGSITYGISVGSITVSNSGWIQLPSGTAPTVDAAGKIALDTTDKAYVGHDGSGQFIVGRATHSFTVTIASYSAVATGYDSQTIPIWQAPSDMAVTLRSCVSTNLGGTSVTFNIDERAAGSLNSSGTNITSSAIVSAQGGTTTTVFSNASIAANAFLTFVTGSSAASGSVNMLPIKCEYSEDVE